MSEEKNAGKVTHYYSNLGVAVVEVADIISVGDKIKLKGATTDFEQTIESMQVDKNEVASAKTGDIIGLKVVEKVREGDKIIKV
ncbi:MAG: hypothetical protein CEN91_276 [Candidatus Berkelbacteria bacterium Licking1014_85]|uniref:Translation elongation factor-like protein n=1 Tax=Candidatus Berkelbacteria bacterium Licking1014_85 TaxID=2017148 RepID=A0A554LKS2_9BACT|nr:MAG: hypothetical protein CEN91_276 [Candidatus Berkelbacteria bacterium Licking1014_85]